MARIGEIVLSGELNGKHVAINGPASVPVAVAIGHKLGHVAMSVSVFDPKLDRNIVSISYDPDVSVGRKVEATEKAYHIEVGGEEDGILTLKINFGRQARNDEIIADASEELKSIVETGATYGKVVVLNGPASLPVAVALGYKLAHISKAVAAYDPKLDKAVVAISHDSDYQVGDLIG
jgi:CRISPR-associated protein Csx3